MTNSSTAKRSILNPNSHEIKVLLCEVKVVLQLANYHGCRERDRVSCRHVWAWSSWRDAWHLSDITFRHWPLAASDLWKVVDIWLASFCCLLINALIVKGKVINWNQRTLVMWIILLQSAFEFAFEGCSSLILSYKRDTI